MGQRIAIVAGTAARYEALATSLRGLGFEPTDEIGARCAVLVDLHDRNPAEASRLICILGSEPILVVGGQADLPALEAAVRAGALDLAIDPSPAELKSRLLLLALRADRQDEEEPRPPALEERQARVLVIEDDEDIRELLGVLLGSTHQLLTASTGEDGLATARRERPDAILLDMVLPMMDGLRVLEQLQRHASTASIPVLFLSAQRSEAMRVQSLEMGATDFIAKPFSAEELRARIAKAIEGARTREALKQLAETDALTGLANFRALHVRLEEELKRATRYEHPLGLLMLDLDGMKQINDRFGHEAGNRAISLVATAIRSELRQTDFAARFGGDEFVVLLPHSGEEETLVIARRLQAAIRGSTVEGEALRCSFGLAAFDPQAPLPAPELLEAADAALYRAKQQGRDRICLAGGAAGAGIT